MPSDAEALNKNHFVFFFPKLSLHCLKIVQQIIKKAMIRSHFDVDST